jgi:ABC-type transporter Mla subunit MlaD
MPTMIRPPMSDEDIANRQAMLAKLDSARDNLEAAFQDWPTLTAAQKDAALRATIRVVALLSRLQTFELVAAG